MNSPCSSRQPAMRTAPTWPTSATRPWHLQPWQLAEPSAALADNRVVAAEAMLRRILRDAPQDVAAMRMLADALARREAYAEAERLLRQALDLAPGYSTARYDLARLLLMQQKPVDVLPLVERLLQLDPKNAVYRQLLASLFGMTGQHAQAIETWGALAAAPNAGYAQWLNYGHELKAAGRSQEGIAAYRRAMALDPARGETYWSLANLKTFRFDAAEIDAMRSLLQREDLRPEDRVDLEFALGKALEDKTPFRGILRTLCRRQCSAPQGGQLRCRQDLAARAALEGNLHAAVLRRPCAFRLAGRGSDFHRGVAARRLDVAGTDTGESFAGRGHTRAGGDGGIARGLATKNGEADESRAFEALCSLDAAQVAALADRYLAETRIYRRGGAPRFIDKMPNNFLNIGLIHLMFPRAAIIDARRHPIGGCFSAFKQHFASGQLFTYDHVDLARFYRDYVELMAHYDAVLPGRIHRVYYERVVADLPREVHRLLEYCGLPFEDQCLRFYETRRGVQTASSEQVRQPIFAEAVGQWRHFEPGSDP